jgi:glutathione S-transferase
LDLPYTAHVIDVIKDEQFAPDFLKISPIICEAAFPTRAGV